jgi:hypothetical protein
VNGNACRTDMPDGKERAGKPVTDLSWFPLKVLYIPACPAGFWTLAHEYIPGGRLLRVKVMDGEKEQPVHTTWSHAHGSFCGPDGVPLKPDKVQMLCSTAWYGALIGKVGGSTGDLPDSTPANTTPWGSKKVFAAGSICILTMALTDGGPLFLTMNDQPERFSQHSGELLVSLDYYPL